MDNTPYTRRQVLADLAGGAAVTPLTAQHSDYRPVLSSQIYVWTQQFYEQHKSLADGLEEAFEGTSRAGFRRIELMYSCFTPDLRAKTIDLLGKHKLTAPVVYNGGVMHEQAAARKMIEQTLQLAGWTKAAGTVAINVNPSPKPNRERKTDAELDTQAKSLNQLAAELRKSGMKLHIHHHDPELRENAREWKHIVQHTDPKLVSFCVDVHWALRGGQDPVAFVREVLSRTSSYHLRNSKQGVWLEELADGDVDYGTIAGDLKKAKYSGYLVVELAYEKETKITRPLEESLKRSRVWAERVFGVKA